MRPEAIANATPETSKITVVAGSFLIWSAAARVI